MFMRLTALKKIFLYSFVPLFSLLLVLVLFHFGLFFLYDGKIYQGVSIAGQDFSGRKYEQVDDELSLILEEYEQEKASFFVDEFSLRLNLTDLKFQFDSHATQEKAKLYGRSGNIIKDFGDELKALFFGVSIPAIFTYDEETFDQIYKVITQKVNNEAKDASLVVHQGKVLVEGAEPKREVILAYFENAFKAKMGLLQKEVAIPTQIEPVVVTNEIAHEKAQEAERLIDRNLELTWENKEWVMEKKEYESFLGFEIKKQREQFVLNPIINNQEFLQKKLQEIALSIDQSMQEAIIKEIDGKKYALQFPKDGQVVDVEKSVKSITEFFTNQSQEKVLLTVTEITSESLAKEGIIDVSTLVASGQSKFPVGAGQESRVHNIQTAAAKLNDYIISSGATFSTINALGEISTQAGYWGGLALIGGRYAPAVGGGVCEVSTDLFRAAIYGGYEIVKRQNHSAIIFHYDWPQRGLDATIFPDSGLDFQFKNNTSYPIIIQTQVDASQGILTINFYSTKKIREVILSESQIYNVVSSGSPMYITDKSLKKGQQILMEVPAPGADVKIIRTIKENGKTSTDEINSHYTPWRAVYLVGE